MKKKKLLICINIIAAFLIAVCLIAATRPRAVLFEQNAAARWAEEFVQLTAIYNADTGISQTEFLTSDRSVSNKLIEASLNEGINSAYSSLQMSVTIKTADGKSSDTTAVLAGGDYFGFHPYTLLSGSYFDGETIAPNVVVLDKTAAWQLFGSYNISGQIVTIGSSVFEVYGVIELPSNRYAGKALAYGESGANPHSYISYASAEKIIPGYADSTKAINVVEYLLPNPVKSTATGIFKEAFSITDESIDVTVFENTNRFSPLRIIPKIPKFNTLGVRDKPLVLPFYENAAVIAETELTALWAGILFIALVPFGTLVILLIFAYKRRKQIGKQILAGIKKLFINIKKTIKKLIEKIKNRKKKTEAQN
jgi:hypothetical protein